MFLRRQAFLPNVDFTQKGAASDWSIQHSKEHDNIINELNKGTPISVGGTDITKGLVGLNFTSADGSVTVTPSADPTADKTNLDLSAVAIIASSLTANGYVTFQGGFRIQWGSDSTVRSSAFTVITYALGFPNNCFGAWAIPKFGGTLIDATVGVLSLAKNQVEFLLNLLAGAETIGMYWIAIGN